MKMELIPKPAPALAFAIILALAATSIADDICLEPPAPKADIWFDCWDCPYQCHGDADGRAQGNNFTGWKHVDTDDLGVLVDAWQIKEPPKGPGLSGNQICADFDHDAQGNNFTGWKRVDTDDLGVLIKFWQVKEPPKGPGVPGDCVPAPVEP